MALFKIDDKTGEKKKVTAADIQANIARIHSTMECINKEINAVSAKIGALDKNSSSYSENMGKLLTRLDLLNRQYTALQEQEEKQYTILKKYKDSKFFIAPKDWLMIGGVSVLGIFGIALDQESPKAMKLANFIMRLFPVKM